MRITMRFDRSLIDAYPILDWCGQALRHIRDNVFPFQNLLFSISCFHDSASKHVFPEFTAFITFHSLKYR